MNNLKKKKKIKHLKKHSTGLEYARGQGIVALLATLAT
jgi:hypothetical protein